MATSNEIRTRLAELLANGDIGAAAGVSAANWDSATRPRVFDGDYGVIGGRNRGRLPFVEYFVASQPFSGAGDGTVQTTIRLVVNVGGYDRSAARTTAESMLMTAFAVIRADHYFEMGSESVDAFDVSPGWHRLVGSLTVVHSFDRATYEE